jgi:hypothetical protein
LVLRAAIWRLAPDAPIPALRPLSALKDAAVAPQRYQFTLLLLSAGIALLLAATGLYALVAHSVTQRRKEMAIRIAPWARAGANLYGLVLSQALAPVVAGAGAGLWVRSRPGVCSRACCSRSVQPTRRSWQQ